MAHLHPLARVARVTSRLDFVAHPHPLARVARAHSVLCAPTRGRMTNSACAACRCRPARAAPPTHTCASHRGCAPSTCRGTAEIHAAYELRTGDIRATIELYNDDLHLSNQQGDIALVLKTHVTSVCFKCCLRGMLQEFRMNVAKVDQDVAYVAMVVYVRCKHLFPMFHLFF
jgi:hypothetical protein